MCSDTAPDAPPAFQRLQRQFAAHLRDPGVNAAPAGVEDRRLAVYRELFYNNVEGFMAASFPVIRRILDDQAWHALVRDYFATHQARTPLFPKMAQEFVRYLEEGRDGAAAPPFLAELAHYEWVEAALFLESAELAPCALPAGEALLDCVVALSPLAWPLAYRYPVHRLAPDYQPDAPPDEPTWLVVFRDRQDTVGFMALNPVSARLLALVEEATGASCRQLLERIAAELAHPDPAVVVRGGLEILEQFRQRDILVAAAP